MSFACLNLKPLKASDLKGGRGHIARKPEDGRKIEAVDAKKTSENVVLVGGDWETPEVDLRGHKARKDANLIGSLVMQASPEWYEGLGKAERRKAALEHAEKAVDWAKERWGGDVVQAHLHMDESTPHVHLWVCPRVKLEDGRTASNFREVFGGPKMEASKKMEQLHDSHGEAMKGLGLSRGERGSQRDYSAVASKVGKEKRDLQEEVSKNLETAPKVRYRDVLAVQGTFNWKDRLLRSKEGNKREALRRIEDAKEASKRREKEKTKLRGRVGLENHFKGRMELLKASEGYKERAEKSEKKVSLYQRATSSMEYLQARMDFVQKKSKNKQKKKEKTTGKGLER